MRLSGEAYSQRLRSYKTSTILLIHKADQLPIELTRIAEDIIADPQLTEEEVAEKLRELIASHSTKTK